MTMEPQARWGTGASLLAMAPLIGALLTITEPPLVLQIVGVVVIVALVFEGSRRLFWKRSRGGWLPSRTLPGDDPHGDE